MPSSTPFVDPETGLLDRYQIRREAESLVKLIGLFVVVALAPLLFALVVGGGTLGFVFTLFAQFVLAVGTGVTLMYVIARAIALSNDETAHARVQPGTRPDRGSRRDATSDEPVDEPDGDASDPAESEDETSNESGAGAEPDADTDESGDSPESSAEPDEDTGYSLGSDDDR